MNERILVVDDDPLTGELTATLLKEAGFDVILLQDSLQAVDTVKKSQPALAVLDILMPGIDGLSLCHKLKNDPQTKGVKVAVVSGKAFHADRKRATDYGADLFIEKPYDVDTFAERIGALIAGKPVPPPPPSAELAQAAIPVPADAKIRLKVWGCRSLNPFKGGEPSRYGRETSCVSAVVGDCLLVFDAGSGIIPLGKAIVADGKYREIWLFLTHFHQDHIEGLGQFAPIYAAGYKINISGAKDPAESMHDRIQRILEAAPPELGAVQADIQLYEMMEENYEVIPGVFVAPFFSNHPGTTLGFTVNAEGRKFIYCPDSEIYGDQGTAMQDYDDRLSKIVRDADLLMHDGRYLDSDYQVRKNNGHSSWLSTLELAARSGIKRLILFHHDDAYNDPLLDGIARDAKAHIAQKGYTLQIQLAQEALEIGL
ncbi:MAG: response regulator [Elusimicrobiota bacterium]|jgi:CheY-like chemotaxis protein